MSLLSKNNPVLPLHQLNAQNGLFYQSHTRPIDRSIGAGQSYSKIISKPAFCNEIWRRQFRDSWLVPSTSLGTGVRKCGLKQGFLVLFVGF